MNPLFSVIEREESGGIMMKNCVVIMNPSSGKEEALDYKKKIEQQLEGYNVTFKETAGEGDAKRFAKDACDAKVDVVVLVGGDGTLNEGINGIAEQSHRPTVGIVPLGTVNDFARALQIPMEPDEAIQRLGGKSILADIGKVNNHYFTNVVAIGELADAVGNVSVEQKTSLGSFAYLLEGVKAAVQNNHFTIEVKTENETFREEVMIFLCVLTNTVGSFKKVNEKADVADGLLHGFLLKKGSMLDILTVAKNFFSGNSEEHDQIITFDAKEMQVSTSSKFHLNVDGDLIETTPTTISILPKHIKFFV